jgi:hypothetical protein
MVHSATLAPTFTNLEPRVGLCLLGEAEEKQFRHLLLSFFSISAGDLTDVSEECNYPDSSDMKVDA